MSLSVNRYEQLDLFKEKYIESERLKHKNKKLEERMAEITKHNSVLLKKNRKLHQTINDGGDYTLSFVVIAFASGFLVAKLYG